MAEINLNLSKTKIQMDICELKKKETEFERLYKAAKDDLQEIEVQLEKLKNQYLLQDKKIETLLKRKEKLELSHQHKEEKAEQLQVKLDNALEKAKTFSKLSLPDDGIVSPLYYFARTCFKTLPSAAAGLFSAGVIIGGSILVLPWLNVATIIPGVVTASLGTLIGCGVIPNFVNSHFGEKLGDKFDKVFGQRKSKTIIADLSRHYSFAYEEKEDEKEMLDNLNDRTLTEKQILGTLNAGLERLEDVKEAKTIERDNYLKEYKNCNFKSSDLNNRLDISDRQLNYKDNSETENKVFTLTQKK